MKTSLILIATLILILIFVNQERIEDNPQYKYRTEVTN